MGKAFSWLLQSCLGGNFLPTCVVVAPLLLSLGADICVGHQVRSSLIKSSLGLLVLTLGSFATVLTLAGFILLRVSILGFIRLGVLDNRVHEFSHVLDRSLESAKFVY